MFTFNEKAKKFLFEISNEFRAMARSRFRPREIESPYMDSMAWLFFCLATMDKPLSELENYCKSIIEGANGGAQIKMEKRQANESAEGSRK